MPATTGNVSISPKAITVSITNQTKQYDTTTAAALTAGTDSNSGSYALSSFVSSDSAYITQTTGSYNNANVASATTVSAIVSSSYVAKGSTVLSNYALPGTVSTTTGGGTITPAPLVMKASDISTYVGVTPTYTYTLTGLLGADTNTSISSAAVSNSQGLATAGTFVNVLTPSATSSNYTLTFVKGALTVADNYQMIVTVGNNSLIYGVVNSGNVSSLGNGLNGSNSISAGYCTNCAVGVTTPTVINLTITAPSAGSNIWTASDNNVSQGKYTFVITPTVPAGSYSANNSLNVGNYVLTASDLATVSGYATNYDIAKPIVYTNGTLSVTPKAFNRHWFNCG